MSREMTEKIRTLLKKTFVDGDIKREASAAQETNLRHAVASNTIFDYPSKWLMEEELEFQCIDWVNQFLLSKEFPDSLAARICRMTRERIFSNEARLEKLKADRGGDGGEGGPRGILTERLEGTVVEALRVVGTELHSELDGGKTLDRGEEEDRPGWSKDVSVHAIKNTRRKMEDRHVVLRHYSQMFGLPRRCSFYAVFDGHGGVEAARFSATQLLGILAGHLLTRGEDRPQGTENGATGRPRASLLEVRAPPGCRKSFECLKGQNSLAVEKTKALRNSYHESDSSNGRRGGLHADEWEARRGEWIRRALERSFLETDRLFCERAKVDGNGSGCTAVCVLLEEASEEEKEGGALGRFHLAWAGDSQALLVRDGRPVEIMSAHKPEREDEKARIVALGGSVVHFGTWRVNGTISVSRAIGDAGHKPYITSRPDVESYDLGPGDEYLVVACDGLWDVLTGIEVVEVVRRHIEVGGRERSSVAQSLVSEAKNKGSSDNITAVVVFLKEGPVEVSTSSWPLGDGGGKTRESDGNSGSKNGDGGDGKVGPGRPGGDQAEPKREGSKTGVSVGRISHLEISVGGNKGEKNDSDSPNRDSETAKKSDSANDDSKENFLSSSSELPLEFSPLRSELDGSRGSVGSRVRRSPKISSSTGDKADKENVNLRLKLCLKIDAPLGGSPKAVDASRGLPKEPALGHHSKKEARESLPIKSPDSKDSGLPFSVPAAAFGSKRHPATLRARKPPFASPTSPSVAFIGDPYGRKFSQASSHAGLSKTPSSANFGGCGWQGRRERWALAIETGEDLEGMFESDDHRARLNVSSSRW